MTYVVRPYAGNSCNTSFFSSFFLSSFPRSLLLVLPLSLFLTFLAVCSSRNKVITFYRNINNQGRYPAGLYRRISNSLDLEVTPFLILWSFRKNVRRHWFRFASHFPATFGATIFTSSSSFFSFFSSFSSFFFFLLLILILPGEWYMTLLMKSDRHCRANAREAVRAWCKHHRVVIVKDTM